MCIRWRKRTPCPPAQMGVLLLLLLFVLITIMHDMDDIMHTFCNPGVALILMLENSLPPLATEGMAMFYASVKGIGIGSTITVLEKLDYNFTMNIPYFFLCFIFCTFHGFNSSLSIY